MPTESIHAIPQAIAPYGMYPIATPFRDAAEYRSTPGIEIAMGFAEACNMHSLRRLKDMLAPDVRYASYWTGVSLKGRDRVLQWFQGRFFRREDGQRYHAQIVVLPSGDAAVLVEILPQRNSALVSFEGEAGIATLVSVTPRYDRKELRYTGYFPPEA